MREEAIMRLALLTDVTGEMHFPNPLTKRMFIQLKACGAIDGLVLCNRPEISEKLFSRTEKLLSRTGKAAACLAFYEKQGYTLMLPGDTMWPQELDVLGKEKPLFLFAKGNPDLLCRKKIAAAGSRNILPETAELARKTGSAIALDNSVLVCGGAYGVDDAVQAAHIAAGGSLILVPAVPVSMLMKRFAYLRKAYEQSRLLILCETLPEQPFSAYKALSRNHMIYALGRAALVVASRNRRGGTWHGATDCMKGGYAPVYTLNGEGKDLEGNRALHDLGAAYLDIDNGLGALTGMEKYMQVGMFEEN